MLGSRLLERDLVIFSKALHHDIELPLDELIINDELNSRPSRAPDYKIDSVALGRIARHLGDARGDILQTLTDIMLETCGADSAGISISEKDGENDIFRWSAISGRLAPFAQGTMPRDFSPCGLVLERDAHMLITDPARHYPYIEEFGVPIYEVLLTPFYRHGQAIGTLWVVAHSPTRKFDREDLRRLQALTEFGSAAVDSHLKTKAAETEKALERRRREEAERDLRTISEIFRQTAVPTAMFRGPEHRFAFVNSPYVDTFCHDENPIGKTVAEIFPEAIEQGFGELLDKVFRTGESYSAVEAEFSRNNSDGSIRKFYLDFSYVPKRDSSNRIEGVLLTAVDVTDRVQARLEAEGAREAAEAANYAKSTFLANMSHEIRSPLGAIVGFADLLKAADFATPEASEFTRVIARNSRHLLRVVDDILDLSKVEAGKMLIEKIQFALPELVTDVATYMQFRATDKGIDFEVRIPAPIPDFVISDPTRLKQILNNVVGNAVKFTERGRVELRVEYSHRKLIFTVSDTGSGLSRVQADRLFKPFQQADASTTRKYGGTGLGLILTRRLAEALGGTFELTASTPGGGSVFTATVGVIVPQTMHLVDAKCSGFAQPAIEVDIAPSTALDGMKILVVDDSADNRTLFELILMSAGAEVALAQDGAEGMKLALSQSYDAILMDVQMPNVDGYEATRTLRGKNYQVPIVALTAHAMKDERAKAMKSGFSDYLSKPVRRDTLLETLRKFRH